MRQELDEAVPPDIRGTSWTLPRKNLVVAGTREQGEKPLSVLRVSCVVTYFFGCDEQDVKSLIV